MKNNNLIGELRIMKDFDIKPNFSALQREYGNDRHTIKKYYENDGIIEMSKIKVLVQHKILLQRYDFKFIIHNISFKFHKIETTGTWFDVISFKA